MKVLWEIRSMKRSAKIPKILSFTFLIVLGTILVFSLKGKTAYRSSNQDLMGSMNISKVAKKIEAPDFMLKDLMGETIRLSDYRGKVVLLNFWTTW